jgi:hypothetical protein
MIEKLLFRIARWCLRRLKYDKLEEGKGCVLVFSSPSKDDVYQVELDYGDHSKTYFVSFENVHKFILASARLHYYPGVNPHNGGQTVRIKEIRINKLQVTGPYWWSAPDLKENFSPGGAVMLEWRLFAKIDPVDVDEDETRWWLDCWLSKTA